MNDAQKKITELVAAEMAKGESPADALGQIAARHPELFPVPADKDVVKPSNLRAKWCAAVKRETEKCGNPAEGVRVACRNNLALYEAVLEEA